MLCYSLGDGTILLTKYPVAGSLNTISKCEIIQQVWVKELLCTKHSKYLEYKVKAHDVYLQIANSL